MDIYMHDRLRRDQTTHTQDAAKSLHAAKIDIGGFELDINLDADEDAFTRQFGGLHPVADLAKELNATSMLARPIETFSTKCRTGPPEDSKSDLDAKVWAGVVPLSLGAGEPVDAPDLIPGIKRPDYL